MQVVAEATVPLRDSNGKTTAILRIAVLPQKGSGTSPALWCSAVASNTGDDENAVHLLEGTEYRYTWELIESSFSGLIADPEEVFQPDTSEGLVGRLRTRLSTGTIRVLVRIGEVTLGELDLEVRSRKLSYLSEYRWMLRDIAERMTELLMDRFAASEAKFELDGTRDAATLYQRFAFLRAMLESEKLQSAFNEILRRPHTAWETAIDVKRAGGGIRADSHVLRQIAKGGPRSAWPSGPFESVPSLLHSKKTVATHDTTPNRFIKFALEHWCQILGDIDRCLSKFAETPAASRGRREIGVVTAHLEELRHHDLFADVGRLTRFPADDQVLQKREGYRDIFKAYVETEFAARLSWHTATDYSAGQQDVATLYEYWAFVQLSQIVASAIGETFDMGSLVQGRSDGLSVGIRTGVETVLSGVVERIDRRMKVELWFNRTYRHGSGRMTSWTTSMRPDYSLWISPADDEPAAFPPIALHFDAKYRVNFASEIFGSEGNGAEENSTRSLGGGPLREDLLKMHAYRDAIRHTAGAYILYPGSESDPAPVEYLQSNELLPSLGAFALRPTEDGEAAGATALARFISDALDHVATRLTRHERSRYWLNELYGQPRPNDRSRRVASPPPGSRVLLGLVKSLGHWDWIHEHKLYSVDTEEENRGSHPDVALLESPFLLLYGPTTQHVALARIVSQPERISRAGILAMGHPEPDREYWCVQVQWVSATEWIRRISPSLIEALVRDRGLSYGRLTSIYWRDLDVPEV